MMVFQPRLWIGTFIASLVFFMAFATAHGVSLNEGLYLGVSAGPVFFNSQRDFGVTYSAFEPEPGPDPDPLGDYKDEATQRSGLGSLFIGVNDIYGSCYIGLEASVNLYSEKGRYLTNLYDHLPSRLFDDNTEDEHNPYQVINGFFNDELDPGYFYVMDTTDDIFFGDTSDILGVSMPIPYDVLVTDTFRVQSDFQLVATPGILLNPSTVVYGRFGMAFARIKLTFRADAEVDERFLTGFCQLSEEECLGEEEEAIPFYESPGAVITENFDKIGFVVGMGIRQQVNEHFGVLAEYQYTNYGKAHWNFDDEYIIGEVVLPNQPAGPAAEVIVTLDNVAITHRLDSHAFRVGVFATF